MADKKSKKEKKATAKGAVEVDEKDLDQAAGGVLIGLSQPTAKPTDSFSLNYSKIETAVQKPVPTYDLGAEGPEEKF